MIGRLTKPWKNAAPILIRVALGSVLLYHGLDRLGIVGPDGFKASINESIQEAAKAGLHPEELWGYVVALSEAIGGPLILLGLFTRYAALALSVLAGVVIFHVQWSYGFRVEAGGWEYTYTLFCCCLYLVIAGGGSLSADELLWPSNREKK